MPDLAKLLKPDSIVVIGASSDEANLRGRFVKTILHNRFSGSIHFVSRSATEIAGHKTISDVSDLAEPADLAVLLVPAEAVCDVLEKCGRAGIGAAVIVASGFAEDGSPEGEERQARIGSIAGTYDMAVCGPNSEGFADLERGLAATFSPVMEGLDPPAPYDIPPGRRISVIAQSGAIGFSFLDGALAKRAPVSFVLTTGNEAFLDLATYLDFFVNTDSADVFLLFIEGLRRPDLFLTVAEKALRLGKPIIAVKIGRSAVSQKATASHTGALAGSYVGYAAAFDRYGMIEARDIDEAIDIANAFATNLDRLPAGRRVGIFSASGGGGGWAADTCADHGLDVPPLDSRTRAELDALLPSYGSSMNPVDATAQALRGVGYARFAEIVAGSPLIDSVIVVCSARTSATVSKEIENLNRVGRGSPKPILFWSYSQPIEASSRIITEAGFALYTSLRNIVRAISAMAAFAEKRAGLAASATPSLTTAAARKVVAEALKDLPHTIPEYLARRLLGYYGINAGNGVLVTTSENAAAAVSTFATACALKVQSSAILHKTDAGGVKLQVKTASEAALRFDEIMESCRAYNPGADIDGVFVEPMAKAGHEIVIGIIEDDAFGHLMMIGWGGTHVEIVNDTVFSLVPVDMHQARQLLITLKVWKVLEGARGELPADIDALVELIVQVSRFAADHRDIVAEMDLNPVLVHQNGQGVSVVDALIVKQRSD